MYRLTIKRGPNTRTELFPDLADAITRAGQVARGAVTRKESIRMEVESEIDPGSHLCMALYVLQPNEAALPIEGEAA